MGLIERRYSLDVCSVCAALARDAITRHRCDYHPDAPLERVVVVPASHLEGAVDAIRTLREYIGNIEGEGPIRYIEALDLCDSFLVTSEGQ